MWGNFLGTLQAMFDTRQAPFRIVLKTSAGTQSLVPGDHCLNIAVVNNQKDAEAAWEWLHSQGDVELTSGVDRKTRIQQVCTRIEELLASQVTGTDEAAADDRFRATSRSFRQIFGLRETERLVSYYACSYGGGLMTQGWMYISEHYLGFYSFIMGVETKLLLELKSITDIRKERSKRNLVPDSIAISTADGRELLFSNMLLSRDEAYVCLQQLVNRALHRILTSTTAGPGAARSPVAGGESSLPSATKPMSSPGLPILTATPTMKEDLERERQTALTQMLFNVPSGEQVLLKIWGVCWTERRPDDIYRGEVYLTNRFVLFITSDHLSAGKGGRTILTLPAGAIRKMEKVYGEEDGVSSKDSPYAISLYTMHHQRIYLAVGAGGGSGTRSSDHFAFRLKQVLSNNVEVARRLIPAASCYASEKLILGAERCPEVYQGLGGVFGYPRSGPMEERRESILLEYWQGHFSEVGRNFAILRTPFFERLVMAGLPCELRGEIWSLCSGTIWEVELVDRENHDEGYYKNLLRQIAREEELGNGSSRASEEIEKDLHR